jgi:preprotein translocase subunit SecG
MLFTFLLIVQTLVAASLVTVILMQRSEGGGLGVGGSTSGLMTARGAADFLTRATAVLATLFVVLSIALAGLATVQRAPSQIDSSLARQGAAPSGPLTGSPAAPITGAPPSPNNDPLAGAAEQAAGRLPPATTAPATPAPANGAAPKQ